MNTNSTEISGRSKKNSASNSKAEPELQLNSLISQGADAVKGFVGTYVVDKVSDTVRGIPETFTNSYSSLRTSVRKRPILFASALIAAAGIGAYFYFRQPPGKVAKRNLH